MRPLPLAAISAMLAAGLPAQYGNPTRTWAFLAAKYDADDNGKISKKDLRDRFADYRLDA